MRVGCTACASGNFSGDTGFRKPAGGFGSGEEIYGYLEMPPRCASAAERAAHVENAARLSSAAACMGMLPAGELSEERDFRMLQGMYPNAAKELLELVEEECDRLEYEGSPMFDEYPDYTTIYTLQKRIADAARKKAGGDSAPEDLIRVMLLQEMHRRRSRYRTCRGVNAL
ncbi:MAG: hypothetical protein LUI39_07525 [Lachnospiraceae bacterium]|nr:hypothetical protein [Lachnospiraceae bacterium]